MGGPIQSRERPPADETVGTPALGPTGRPTVHALVIAVIVYVAIFLAELPDKTALASLVLGTRYRGSLVWLGLAAAFVVHVVIAVAAGQVLRLLPHRPLEIVVAVLFAVGALLLLREGGEHEEVDPDAVTPGLSPLRVVATSFGVIFLAELGDLTQLLTANLAARYHDPFAVGIGAVLALWSVGALAIVGGKALLARIPLRLITRLAATIMVVLAAYSVVSAAGG
jgi:putative Ca2+/H+ antiporter (TMEM165/GDT1 family)